MEIYFKIFRSNQKIGVGPALLEAIQEKTAYCSTFPRVCRGVKLDCVGFLCQNSLIETSLDLCWVLWLFEKMLIAGLFGKAFS